MRRPAIFIAYKTVCKTDQMFLIECTYQRSAGCSSSHELCQRHDIKVRHAPHFFLQFLAGTYIVSAVNLANDEAGGCVRLKSPCHQNCLLAILLRLTSGPV